ncbi:SIS domain-containing protein [Ohessyouella blattaphilus]|uniref:SIS domain-containing protein n=1 Tax=Ohessyouella blattaphilus TaxID=2949333 RepID=A0ABT1EI52_9FIRM|nr:SIS domain-containing protein [Ohessyouella blattaphilus]MCP1110378.1 SIS domain-containing protein [Ohessyouella blattaphilus]MCR8563772.1 SIS domain-containing protein [Ohessyouella blattaphilus]
MLKFDKEKKLSSVKGALALRPEIEKIVDEIQNEGFDAVYFMGIGGTWASSMQVEVYMRGKSSLPVFVENAAEYLTTGNKRITSKSVVIFSSVTGTTQEMVEAIKVVKELGARVLAFIDIKGTALEEMSDYCVIYPENEQLKFYMVANRLMFNNGEFSDYDQYNQEMEAHLAEALVDVEIKADDFAKEFAAAKYEFIKKNPDMPHYFVGAGNQLGSTYSYAMCYWEEQMWIRTKSISAPEFFHGMLEVIEAETPVILFVGEDEQRVTAERVANFLPKVCRNYVIIDSKDYELKGISGKFRGSISHLVTHGVTNRIDVHMEKELCHPLQIRRYYRQFDY